MATYTTNYNLKKIGLTDSPPDITELNGNFDTIDTTMKGLSDVAPVMYGSYNSVNNAVAEAAWQANKGLCFKSGYYYYWLTQRKSSTYHVFWAYDGENKKLMYRTLNANTWTSSFFPIASLESPEFTGTPSAPTAAAGTNTTQLATTAFVQDAANTAASGKVGKASSATTGNFMKFDSSGNAADSGKKASDFAAASHTHSYLPLSGGTMTGAISMSDKKITGLANGTSEQDAVNKRQLDSKLGFVKHADCFTVTFAAGEGVTSLSNTSTGISGNSDKVVAVATDGDVTAVVQPTYVQLTRASTTSQLTVGVILIEFY